MQFLVVAIVVILLQCVKQTSIFRCTTTVMLFIVIRITDDPSLAVLLIAQYYLIYHLSRIIPGTSVNLWNLLREWNSNFEIREIM